MLSERLHIANWERIALYQNCNTQRKRRLTNPFKIVAGGTQNWTSFGRQNDAALVGKMIVSPEVIVEAAGPLGDAPSRPIKAFYNLCGYDPSEE